MLKKWMTLFLENHTRSETPFHPVAELKQVRFTAPGREQYIASRRSLLEQLLKSEEPRSLVFEQFSYNECFLVAADLEGNVILITDSGKRIDARLKIQEDGFWDQTRRRMELLLGQTIKRDELPLTGFGHAAFFFIIGRNVYVSRKHIPLIEKETNGFAELHRELLDLKNNLLDLA